MCGGGSTAEKYAKFGAGEYGSSDFERYVDSNGDLAAAWNKIESDPTAWDSKYWIDKGATSKAAFGRAHAAEDAELYAGTYGAGGTKVVPGSAEYDAYFGDSGGTRFDTFLSSPPLGDGGGDGGGASRIGGQWIIDDYLPPVILPTTGIGPYPADNMYFPQLTHAYETPQAQDWSQYGLLDPNYQPWSVQGGQQFVPENIWNYAPPQINRQPVQYAGPPMGGLMEVIMPAEESKSTTNPNDDLENRGGKGLEQYGDLAGLGTWQGDKFADIHGNVWDGNDFDTDTELAAMVSYGNPNATKAFNDWQGWDTKPGQTVGLFGAASGEDDNSSSEFGPASHMI